MIGLASPNLGRTDGLPTALLGPHPRGNRLLSQPLESWLGNAPGRPGLSPREAGNEAQDRGWRVHQPRRRALTSLSDPSPAARGSQKSGSDGPRRATGGEGALTWRWGMRGEDFRGTGTRTAHPSTEDSGPTLGEGEAARCSRPGGGALSAGTL